MMKLLVVLGALSLGSAALAGPNAGGTLIVQNPVLAYTTDITDYCGLGQGIQGCDCLSANTNLLGSDSIHHSVWKVYAAFPVGSSPKLKAVSWGIQYTPNIIIIDKGACIGDLMNGAAEFDGPGWPGSGTGTELVEQFTQTSCMTELYWFAGYSYDGSPGCFCTRDNPDPGFGGRFADDSGPAILDPIAGYGCMGFDNPNCGIACPQNPVPTGACCVGHTCTVQTQQDCIHTQGNYLGDGTTCVPNPCPPDPVPVRGSSWGRIKATYR